MIKAWSEDIPGCTVDGQLGIETMEQLQNNYHDGHLLLNVVMY